MVKNVIRQIAIVVVSVFLLAEIYYRTTGKYKTYNEKTGGGYVSSYGQSLPSWYLTLEPNKTYSSRNSEFNYSYSTNAHGLREKNILAKKDSVIRILVFGDSFAEGVGAPYDSTWPRLLENELIRNDINCEVLNAGIAGSDIFYAYVLYRDRLSKLDPDIVLMSMNGSDYIDFFLRGGMERFSADGTVRGTPLPWFEFFYKHSHFFRALLSKVMRFPFSSFFVTESDYNSGSGKNNLLFANTIIEFKNTATSNKADFIAVIHSTAPEILWKTSINDATIKNLDALSSMLKEGDVSCYNISNALTKRFSKEKIVAFSYTNDMHFNPVGYAFMGKAIADSLLTSGVLKRETKR